MLSERLSRSSRGHVMVHKLSSPSVTVIMCFVMTNLVTMCYSADHKWHYDEQHSWANLPNSKCAELRQSPINIETNDVTDGDTALTLIGYDDPLDGSYFTLENNGHTIQLTIEDDHLDSDAIPRAQVNNGNSYRFKQLHFHWHQNDSKGSEHAINGRQSALEMHNVHWNEKYETIGEALNHADGILVVASLFKVSSKANDNLSSLTRLFKSIEHAKTRTSYKEDLLLGKFIAPTESFYHYNGSLTTPPCSVAVSWFVLTEASEISREQLETFRSVMTHDHSGNPRRMAHNVRDMQPVGNRQIVRSSLIARQDFELLPDRVGAGSGVSTSPSLLSQIVTVMSLVTAFILFTSPSLTG